MKQPGLKTARLGLTIVARCTSAFKLTMMRTEAAGDAHAQPTQQAFALQAWIAALPGQPRTNTDYPQERGYRGYCDHHRTSGRSDVELDGTPRAALPDSWFITARRAPMALRTLFIDGTFSHD